VRFTHVDVGNTKPILEKKLADNVVFLPRTAK